MVLFKCAIGEKQQLSIEVRAASRGEGAVLNNGTVGSGDGNLDTS